LCSKFVIYSKVVHVLTSDNWITKNTKTLTCIRFELYIASFSSSRLQNLRYMYGYLYIRRKLTGLWII